MAEVLDLEENKEPQGIPVFLKVLCILTFIGAGIGILSGLWNVFTFNHSLETLENMQGFGRNTPFGDMTEMIETTKKWGFLSHLMTLAGNILCLTGALLMFRLKKSGFYIYIFGQVLPLVAGFGLMQGMTAGGGMFAGLMVVGMIVGAIFPIAFVIMYGLNLKHMR